MSEKNSKVLTFMKKNAVYVILALCVLAVGLSVTFVLLKKENRQKISDTQVVVKDPIENDEPVVNPDIPDEPVSNIITFIMPVANASEIVEYSEQMVFNSTLKRFSAHKAIDFYAEEGTDVYACYDGEIESIEKTLLQGTTITIKHKNGLQTVYNSLLDGDCVTVGQP